MSSALPVPDTVELARFRDEWKEELRQLRHTQADREHTPGIPFGDDQQPPSDAAVATIRPLSSASAHVVSAASGNTPSPHSEPSRNFAAHQFKGVADSTLQRHSHALAAYRTAVQAEQRGDYDDAIQYYRQAYKLNSFVDKAFHKEELRLAAAEEQSRTDGRALGEKESAGKANTLMGDVEKGVKRTSLQAPTSSTAVVTGALAALVSDFPKGLSFDPEDEQLEVQLRILPEELLITVLKLLDAGTIERFAQVDRKARVLTLDSGIWRHFVRNAYIYPQVTSEFDLERTAERYLFDYRRFYIEHPRLRLEGVYIAVCHYVRAGLSENAWVSTNHLITYHRYLRFFPDGQVISVLANENIEPQSIIPQLKPTLQMKGMSLGTWSLHGSTVFVSSLRDPTDRTPRYMFQMTLNLRSRPLGRWNKLDLSAYESISLDTGEVLPFVLKNERPFWFSKVRSYAHT